jgi:hypothetical protein
MGTTLSDTLYMGYAHAAPPPVPEKQSRWIESRWLEWAPWCTIAARRSDDPSGALYALRVTHRSRLISLLSARVAWDTIRKHHLDNPTDTTELFEFQLRAAVERRRTRMGRVKGKGKKYATNRRSH